MTYDPLVVDSTAELDRILEPGHAQLPSMACPPSPPVPIPHPDAVQNSPTTCVMSPSPKRPRSPQTHLVSPLFRSTRHVEPSNFEHSMNAPTPCPARRCNVLPFYTSPATAQPKVRLHLATPSSTRSKFTCMARGINKKLEATQQELNAACNARQTIPARPTFAPAERNPFHDTHRIRLRVL